MNIDAMIGRAIEVLDTVGIVQTDKKDDKKYINKSFRGQISSFGAAVQMGSLISAVAFYSSQGGAETDRSKLMDAIYLLVTNEKTVQEKALLRLVVDKKVTKQQAIDAAVAIKLAMNAYELRSETNDDKDKKESGKEAGDES